MNNPNYSFPWGLPPSNPNPNPFYSSTNPFANRFAEDTHISHLNGNGFQPSPWNDNYNPHSQPQANRWNQWIPSPQPPRATQHRPPATGRRPLLSPSDLRNTLVKKKKKSEPPIKNSGTGITSLSKPQVLTDTTINVSVFRNYALPLGTTPPTVNRKVQRHFQAFQKILLQFMDNPSSSLFGSLVKELIMCSKNVGYIEEIQKFIDSTLFIGDRPWLGDYTAPPCKGMRIFWLLAEIYRPAYDRFFGNVRIFLKADELFQEFLRKYTVEDNFTNELQAIWFYWKSYVHANVIDRIVKTCHHKNLKNIVRSVPNNSTLLQHYAKIFGNATLSPSSNSIQPQPLQKPIPIVFEVNKVTPEATKKTASNVTPIIQRNNVVAHNYGWPAKFSLPSATSITPAKPKPVSHVNPQESINVNTKIAKFLSLLDKLVTIDRSEAPKAASELLYCFLEHGSDHQLSDRIIKETTKRLQEICNNNKIIRVLWVLGYLFFPKYESKITALKPILEKIAARLFWICLSKTHRDATTREEMRVILKLWREIVHEETISSVMARIKDTIASDPNVNLNWILNDNNIRKGTRIVDFYNNKYLMNASTAGPKSKAKEKKPTSEEDNDDEVMILDKCDVIQPTTTDPQKNREDKRAGKQMSDESLDAHRKLKKRTKVAVEDTDNIFTEFHRIPSKPVNLVKPVLRTEATTDDSTNFNCSETGDSCVFNSGSTGTGNQEQQQSGGLSKLELFRKKMEKDAAIASIGGGHRWNDTSLRENKEIYLRKDWTIDEFVYCVCNEEFQTCFDIVRLNGELRVKITRK